MEGVAEASPTAAAMQALLAAEEVVMVAVASSSATSRSRVQLGTANLSLLADETADDQVGEACSAERLRRGRSPRWGRLLWRGSPCTLRVSAADFGSTTVRIDLTSYARCSMAARHRSEPRSPVQLRWPAHANTWSPPLGASRAPCPLVHACLAHSCLPPVRGPELLPAPPPQQSLLLQTAP